MRALFIITIMNILLFACSSPQPAVVKLEPEFGLLHGGEKAIIHGKNLDALMPAMVYFGNTRVYITQLHSSNELWVTTPASSNEKVVDVRIIANDGSEYLMEQAFQYVAKADMAECVNISKKINGKPVLERKSKRM